MRRSAQRRDTFQREPVAEAPYVVLTLAEVGGRVFRVSERYKKVPNEVDQP